MLVAILHLIGDADDPAGIIAQVMDAVPAGSMLAISHVPNDMHMGAMSDMSDRLNRLLSQPSTYRSKAQVTGFFAGLELVDPRRGAHPAVAPGHRRGGRGGRRDVGGRRSKGLTAGRRIKLRKSTR